MKVEIDDEKIVQRAADSTGRVSIGTEYAKKEVKVAVLEVSDRERFEAERVIERLEDAGKHEAAQAVAETHGIELAE